MFTYRNNEKFMVCPYDANHVMLPLRYESHVLKCALKHEKNLTQCPFNGKHHVEKGELRAHMAICPDRYRVEKELLFRSGSKSNQENEEIQIQRAEIDETIFKSGENWDDECDISFKQTLRYKLNKSDYCSMTKTERRKEREKAIEEYKKKLQSNTDTDELSSMISNQLNSTRLSTINESDNFSDTASTHAMRATTANDDASSTRGSIISSSEFSQPRSSRGRGILFASRSNTSGVRTSLSIVTDEAECDTNSVYASSVNSSGTRLSYSGCIRQTRFKN